MRYNKKIICIGVIKAIAFLLVFVILFQGVTDLFRTKDCFYAVSPIYDLPKNSVDVLLLGGSHMNCTISPMDLWDDYGITSFNAAISSRTIPESYFELRELLKVQNPKIVVLETYFIYQEEMVTPPEENLHLLVNNIPLSLGVMDAVETLIHEDHDKTGYYLNFYSFHNRWKELSEGDFKPSLKYCNYNRGADDSVYARHSEKEYSTPVSRSEVKMPPEVSLEYLYKIIELCREKEIQLVFMAQLFDPETDWRLNDRIKMMNYVDIVAAKEEIPYVNFFDLIDEIGFDFSKDLADHHVNYFGAQKHTSYLGEYLQTNYQLEDHRGNPAVADLWNKDYETFARELNNKMMKTAGGLDEYWEYLQKEDYILAWSAYSETPLSEPALPELLESMGIEQAGVKGRQWYCAVTRGGRVLYRETPEKGPTDSSFMAEDTLFSFGRGITGSSNRIGVHCGRKEYSVGSKGINLVVYDPVSKTVVDSVNIDLDTEDIKR